MELSLRFLSSLRTVFCAFFLVLLSVSTESVCVGQETAPAGTVFSRIALVGASVTAGFDESQPLGGPKALEYRFANYIDAALADAHEPIITKADALLFFQPKKTLNKQLTGVLEKKPSLVIAIDALFWFCYGAKLKSDERIARFESGLQELERIDAPLVVGDIPDASQAVGGILSADEMPDLSIIEKCNQRLKEWAAAHSNVTVFPIASFMHAAAHDEELVFNIGRVEKGKTRALLRDDLLHPSQRGLAMLAASVLNAVATTAKTPVSASAVRKDLDAIYEDGVLRGKALADEESKKQQ